MRVNFKWVKPNHSHTNGVTKYAFKYFPIASRCYSTMAMCNVKCNNNFFASSFVKMSRILIVVQHAMAFRLLLECKTSSSTLENGRKAREREWKRALWVRINGKIMLFSLLSLQIFMNGKNLCTKSQCGWENDDSLCCKNALEKL